VEKPEKRRPLGRRCRRREDNTKIDLQGITLGVNQIALSQDLDRSRLL